MAIPLLAALVLVNQQEVFRRRVTRSVLVETTRVVAQLCAVAGVVAGFWHIHWIAGVGMLAGGLVGAVVQSVGYGAWNGIACWNAISSRRPSKTTTPAAPGHSAPPATPAADDHAAAATLWAGLGRLTPMTDLDEHGRPEPPLAGNEAATLLGFLDYQRATMAWKTAGLDAKGLQATTAASTMTLGGLLKHMAYVEDLWCSRWLHGHDPAPPWDTVDWEADRDWDWHSAAEDSPEQLHALWEEAVGRSRTLVGEALADGGLGRLARRRWPDGRSPSLRWVLCHLIEEYARHNGHADLLRESVDGQTGE